MWKSDEVNSCPEASIRGMYASMGVTEYYENHGQDYSNPHAHQVKELLRENRHRIDYTKSLDLSCGAGEVSMTLIQMGYTQVEGCDPYTAAAYEKNIGRPCKNISFLDIINGCLEGERYSSVICSFAMHLCPEKQVRMLVYQLFQVTDQIVILTPHKRPDLLELADCVLDFEDTVKTCRNKQVRIRAYKQWH